MSAFLLDYLPDQLKKRILEKMNKTSFYRMRRVNKRNANFITAHRHSFKIPGILPGATVTFRREPSTRLVDMEISLERTSKNRTKQFQIVDEQGMILAKSNKRGKIFVSLNAVLNKKSLIGKELGNFAPTMVWQSGSPGVNAYCALSYIKDENFEIILQVIEQKNWRNTPLSLCDMKWNRIKKWCEAFRPSALKINGRCVDIPGDFLQEEGLENVTLIKLDSLICPIEKFFNMKHIGFDTSDFTGPVSLLRNWTQGEAFFEVLWIETDEQFPLAQFDVKPIPNKLGRRYTKKLVKKAGILCKRETITGKYYLLKQENTRKFGFCVQTESTFCFCDSALDVPEYCFR